MFRRHDKSSQANGDNVTIHFEDAPIICKPTDSVAAAVLLSDPGYTRRTPVTKAPRAPYCMMGTCFECLMDINGVENQQACMVPVRDGMKVRRQNGVPVLPEDSKEPEND